jgi:hypothetical protein
MNLSEIRTMLDSKATVDLWPTCGEVLGLSRGQTYRLAKEGKIETLDLGRVKRVTTAWLRRKLGIEQAA